LTTDLTAEITRVLSASKAVESPFAVRSSASFEDGGKRSWAGQFTTVLRVADDGLEEAILQCWRSAFSLHALSYNPAAYRNFGFAVVIQRMVEPDASGVLFSYDPTHGGQQRALLEATPGTGELLVGGGEVPLALYLQRPGGLVVRRRASHPRNEALLLPDHISKLWGLALAVEELFGCGVDIEWAMVGDEPVLLQARPITAASMEGSAPELLDGVPDPSKFELTFKVGGLPFLMADILTEGFGYLAPFFVFSKDEFRQYFPERIMDWAATEGYRWLRLDEGFQLYQSEFEDFYRESKAETDLLLENATLDATAVGAVWKHCSEVMRRYSRMDFQFTNLVAAYAGHDVAIGANLERLAKFKDRAREWVNDALINVDSAFGRVVGRLADQLKVSSALVVYLSKEELAFALRRGFVNEGDSQAAEARSKAYAIFTSSAQGPEYLSGTQAADLFDRVVERERVLEGAPLHGEVANRAGLAHLVGMAYVLPVDYGDPQELAAAVDGMPHGDILFAEFTAPELLRACEKASGIVTDLGGMLSHAAIVSRELGVPCVVGTKVGTHVIRTGDRVQIDLTSGSIERVDA
jgi:pyruvate,water dikinase